MKISDVKGLQIFDSRGNPTVAAYITLDDGSIHSAKTPSGASTGIHEAKELRDQNKSYDGLGVMHAVNHINTTIRQALLGKSILSPEVIDRILLSLDASPDKSIIGANALLAVSQAAVRASAYFHKQSLWHFISDFYFPKTIPNFPRLFVNVINGGRHANWDFDIQEFIISPLSSSPHTSLKIASEIFHEIGTMLHNKNLSTLLGDEGGYSPALHSNEEVFALLHKAGIEKKYLINSDYEIGIDAAASEFYIDGEYLLKKENVRLNPDQLLQRYVDFHTKYYVRYFEDPFYEEDWKQFGKMTMQSKNNFLVIGDDLYTTDSERVLKGIQEKATNAIIIKPNQIGTILETVETINTARTQNWKIIISHRSGDTEDTFIADLAYGCGADFLKSGSISRSERTSKYNRLLEIEAFEEKKS